MNVTGVRVQSTLSHAVDPLTWARAHPWIALGAATAVGFGTAVTALRKKPHRAESADGKAHASNQPARTSRFMDVGRTLLRAVGDPLTIFGPGIAVLRAVAALVPTRCDQREPPLDGAS